MPKPPGATRGLLIRGAVRPARCVGDQLRRTNIPDVGALRNATAALAALIIGASIGLLATRDGGPAGPAQVKGLILERTPTPEPAEPTPPIQTPTLLSPGAEPVPSGDPASTPDAPDVLAAPQPTRRPAATLEPDPVPRNPRVRPATIDCTREPQFCSSSSWSMDVAGGLESVIVSSLGPITREAPRFPTFTLEARPVTTTGATAGTGDRVTGLALTMRIVNDSSTPYFFPEGELGLQMTRDGVAVDVPAFKAGFFAMRTGEDAAGNRDVLEASYKVAVPGDGHYEWRGVTFFYD